VQLVRYSPAEIVSLINALGPAYDEVLSVEGAPARPGHLPVDPDVVIPDVDQPPDLDLTGVRSPVKPPAAGKSAVKTTMADVLREVFGGPQSDGEPDEVGPVSATLSGKLKAKAKASKKTRKVIGSLLDDDELETGLPEPGAPLPGLEEVPELPASTKVQQPRTSGRRKKGRAQYAPAPAPARVTYPDNIKRPHVAFDKYVGKKNETSEAYCLADRAQFLRADAFCDLNGGMRMRRVSVQVISLCTCVFDEIALVDGIRREKCSTNLHL
jgi:hypothetical protein